MRPTIKYLCLVIFIIFIFSSCTDVRDQAENQLKISAAASLTDVLAEITSRFEEETGIESELNLAASSILAKQIANGLKSDFYISANRLWIDYLVKEKYIESNATRIIFSNSLVIIASAKSKLNLSAVNDLLQTQVKTIAIGDPEHVPAGIYAKETLKNAGIWENVDSKLVGTIDVRAALAYVQNGSADCAIVYASDLYKRNDVKPVLKIPDTLVPDIKYVAGIIKAGNKNLAKKFETFLMDSAQQKIFKKYGFKPL
jgi:molybdate transport system substrate-binding protein